MAPRELAPLRGSGHGRLLQNPGLIAPNRGLALKSGALLPWATPRSLNAMPAPLDALGKRHGFKLDEPLENFSEEALSALFYGEDKTAGPRLAPLGLRRNWMGGVVAPGRGWRSPGRAFLPQCPGGNAQYSCQRQPLARRYSASRAGDAQYGDAWRDELARFRQSRDCPDCKGARLRPEALSVRVGDLNIAQFCDLPVDRARKWLAAREFTGKQALIAEPLLKEITGRLAFMENVGLDYLSLGRSMNTLSGGEGPAHSPGLATGLPALWALRIRSGRAFHRPASARQRASARHFALPAETRQYGAGCRA